MNAEQIIANAVEDIFADHQLDSSGKRCSCGRWALPNKQRQWGTVHIQHRRHLSEEIGKRLTQRATWKAAALLLFLLLPTGAKAQTCDQTLWQHVYNPQRLVVKQQCISVTGTIVDATHGKRRDGLRHEGDGDTHGWLKVDPEFASLLNAGNRSNEGGNLVFEVICQYRVTQADAKAACKNFKSSIVIPPPGTRVRITGTYVQDQEHAKWMELHPVTRIEVLP